VKSSHNCLDTPPSQLVLTRSSSATLPFPLLSTARDPKITTESIVRVGFFGGSFDPIHLGHLIAAQDALEQLKLKKVVFLPTAQAPLRDNSVYATAEDRMEMIRLAIGSDRRFEISDLEIARGGISYTYETVAELQRQEPEIAPIWIIGEDQITKLPRWHRIHELSEKVEFAWLQRPGHLSIEAPNIASLRLHPLRSHQIEISSSEIRSRIREKRPLRFLLLDPVIAYINERKLYE